MPDTRQTILSLFASPWVRIATVALLALGLRLAYVSRHSMGEGERILDALHYHQYAVSMLDAGKYTDELGDRLFRMPGYPVVLTVSYTLFGRGVLPVQLIQVLAASLACLALYAVALRLYGPKWALFIGVSAAFYDGLTEPCARVLTESLGGSLVCFFFWAWICVDRAWISTILSGSIMGVASLIRPDLGPFAGACCILLPWLRPGRGLRHAVVFGGLLLACFLPWICRNWLVFHRFVPGSTQAEAALCNGLTLPLAALGDIGPKEVKSHPAGMYEMDHREYYKTALRELLAKTPLFKIVRAYVFNVSSMYYPFLPEYDWSFVLFVPFWFWAILRIRSEPELRPALILLVLYTAVHVVAGGPISRYRKPLSGSLLLLATAGCRDLEARFGKRFWVAGTGWLAANLFLVVVGPLAREVVLELKKRVFGR
ncbi:MAG: glycosyltransferase family 39 protein [Elusimicrobia bacterium]|nr:glycosyltransferase family 39 protein [Elusimicrobiota bacterium]